jgi:hypothetical protein
MHTQSFGNGAHGVASLVCGSYFLDLIGRQESEFVGLQAYRAGIVGVGLLDDRLLGITEASFLIWFVAR